MHVVKNGLFHTMHVVVNPRVALQEEDHKRCTWRCNLGCSRAQRSPESLRATRLPSYDRHGQRLPCSQQCLHSNLPLRQLRFLHRMARLGFKVAQSEAVFPLYNPLVSYHLLVQGTQSASPCELRELLGLKPH